MAVYAITFRIHDDSTRQERYDSFVEKVEELGGVLNWDETTSFFIIESDLEAAGLRYELYHNTKVDASSDKCLIINLSSKDYAHFGELSLKAILDTLMKAR